MDTYLALLFEEEVRKMTEDLTKKSAGNNRTYLKATEEPNSSYHPGLKDRGTNKGPIV